MLKNVRVSNLILPPCMYVRMYVHICMAEALVCESILCQLGLTVCTYVHT